MTKKISTIPLERALTALSKSIAVSKQYLQDKNTSDALRETLQAGVIQHFEVAYELSWKFIQRWLKENRPSTETESPRTRKELFRLAAEAKLIADPSAWFQYGDARNATSHTYNEIEAQSIFQIATQFLTDAQALLAELEKAT